MEHGLPRSEGKGSDTQNSTPRQSVKGAPTGAQWVKDLAWVTATAQIPGPGTSRRHGYGLKKEEKKNKTEDKIKSFAKYFSLALLFLRKLLQGVFH